MLRMLTGAAVGAVLGALLMLLLALSVRAHFSRVLAVLEREGPQAARRLLDQRMPARVTVSGWALVRQTERLAALAALGDVDALRREMPAHRTRLAYRVVLHRMGLLGVAVRTQGEMRAAAVRELTALADEAERDLGPAQALVKRHTRALAALGQALLGSALPAEHLVVVHRLARRRSFSGLLIAHALARGLRATNMTGSADRLDAQVRAVTRAFDANVSSGRAAAPRSP
jgi:hypothetical protein